MIRNQRGFGVVEIVIIIVVIGVIAILGWNFINNQNNTNQVSDTQQNQLQAPSSKTDNDSDDKRQDYTNKTYGISFKYPNGWSIGTNGWGGYKLDITFNSVDRKITQLDNGYSFDSGGEFGLLISSFDSSEIDISYKQAAERYLNKPTIDTTAELIKLLQTPDALSMQSYDSPETIDGIAAGRGHFGDYTHGPWVFWVKNHLLYQIYYDGPNSGSDKNRYGAEFEALLKSISLE